MGVLIRFLCICRGRSMAFTLWKIARCSVVIDTILEYPYEKPKKESIA